MNDLQSIRKTPGRKRSMRTAGLLLALALVAATLAQPADADETWDFSLGAGTFLDSAYPGSPDHYVAPVVSFRAAYTRGKLTGFFSVLEGLGVNYLDPATGVLGSVVVGQGDRRHRESYSLVGFDIRHSDRTRQLLEGSDNLSTPLQANVTLGKVTRVGVVGLSLAYSPTTVESPEAGSDKATRSGFLYGLDYYIGLPVTGRLALAGMLAVKAMNGSYADAWYSAGGSTAAMPVFAAGAGWKSAQLAVQLDYVISETVSLSLIAATTRFLGDAARSPYTVKNHQQTALMQVVYDF